MSDQMQAGASSAHPTVNVTETLANLKQQIAEIGKILQSHGKDIDKLKKIGELNDKIIKQIKAQTAATNEQADATDKAKAETEALAEVLGTLPQRAKGATQEIDKLDKKTKETNKSAQNVAGSIVDVKNKTKDAGTAAKNLKKNYQAALNIVKRMKTQLKGAEISGAVFGEKFNVGDSFKNTFKAGLKSMIGEISRIAGGPENNAARRLLREYKEVAERIKAIKKEMAALEKDKSLSGQTALDSLKKDAMSLIPALKKINTEITRLYEKPNSKANLIGPVQSFKNQAKKEMYQALGKLKTEKMAIETGPVPNSLASRFRLVNIELAKYAALERAGYSTDTKYAQSLGFTAKKLSELHAQQKKLNREMQAAKGNTTGATTNWATGALQQAKYWGRLRLMFAGYQKVMKGMRAFVDLEGTINRALRTSVKNTSDWNEITLARNQIQNAATKYLSRHIGTIGEYTEAIYQLTQAEMARNQAIRLAPTVMALSKALDAPITEATRLLVGLNELFDDTLNGMESDTERIQHIASVLAIAVKKEVTSVKDLTKSLGYVAPIGKMANMSIEEIIASLAILHTNLMQASRAGTSMRQMINAIAKNMDKLNDAFNLDIDPNEPFKYIATLERLSQKIKGGSLPVAELQKLLGGFKLRGAPGAIILAENFEKIVRRFKELKGAKIDDLLGMRDIVERNVPGQMKILSQNIDLIVASFLRGAVGGQDLADSLAKVNDKMYAAMGTAKSLGDIIGFVTQKEILFAAGGVYVVTQLAKIRKAMIAMKAVSMSSVIGASLVALTAVLYIYNQHKIALERRRDEVEKNLISDKKQVAQLREVSKMLDSNVIGNEKLAAAKALLSKRTQRQIDAFKSEAKAIDFANSKLKDKIALIEKTNKARADELIKFETAKAAKAFKDFRKAPQVVDAIENIKNIGLEAGFDTKKIKKLARSVANDYVFELQKQINFYKNLSPYNLKTLSIGRDRFPRLTGQDFKKKLIEEMGKSAESVQAAIAKLFITQEIGAAKASAKYKELVLMLDEWNDSVNELLKTTTAEKIAEIDNEDISFVEKIIKKTKVYNDEIRENDRLLKSGTDEIKARLRYIAKIKPGTKEYNQKIADANALMEEQRKKAVQLLKVNRQNVAAMRALWLQQQKIVKGGAVRLLGAQGGTIAEKLAAARQQRQMAVDAKLQDLKKLNPNIDEKTLRKSANKSIPEVNASAVIRNSDQTIAAFKSIVDTIKNSELIKNLTKNFAALDPNKAREFYNAFLTGPQKYYANDKKGKAEYDAFIIDFMNKNKNSPFWQNPHDLKNKGLSELSVGMLDKNQIEFLKKHTGEIWEKLKTKDIKENSPFIELKNAIDASKILWNANTVQLKRQTVALNENTAAILANKFPGRYSPNMPKHYSGSDVQSRAESIDKNSRLQITLNVDGQELKTFMANTGETLNIAVPILEETAGKANAIIANAKFTAQRIRQYNV